MAFSCVIVCPFSTTRSSILFILDSGNFVLNEIGVCSSVYRIASKSTDLKSSILKRLIEFTYPATSSSISVFLFSNRFLIKLLIFESSSRFCGLNNGVCIPEIACVLDTSNSSSSIITPTYLIPS